MILFYRECKNQNKFDQKEKRKVSSETLGGAEETVEKLKLNSSCEAEEKVTLQNQTKSTK